MKIVNSRFVFLFYSAKENDPKGNRRNSGLIQTWKQATNHVGSSKSPRRWIWTRLSVSLAVILLIYQEKLLHPKRHIKTKGFTI